MKTAMLFLTFNLICIVQVVSQINLIPNYSFENGSGTPGIERYDHPEQPRPCYCRYIPTPFWETKTAAAKEFAKILIIGKTPDIIIVIYSQQLLTGLI